MKEKNALFDFQKQSISLPEYFLMLRQQISQIFFYKTDNLDEIVKQIGGFYNFLLVYKLRG